MKRIAVVTSGGDAPGMNAAVRAVVRTGIARGLVVFGVRNGYEGLIGGQFTRLGARDVGGIIGHAGTFLGTTRCEEMKSVSGQAAAIRRAFLVEVMGRASGHLALAAGIAGGAEAIIVPEVEHAPETIAYQIHQAYERGKRHAIVVVAEGAKFNAGHLANYFAEHSQQLGFELRVTTLGHVQRGGAPGVFDRLLATRLGSAAVERLVAGEAGMLVGVSGGNVITTPLAQIVEATKPLDSTLLELAEVLAR